jgi:ribosomal protein S18 acetylase RimI-like enzyme
MDSLRRKETGPYPSTRVFDGSRVRPYGLFWSSLCLRVSVVKPIAREAIRALLVTDRPWSVYALGDLAPGFFEECEWAVVEGARPAVALVYRGFGTPILFTLGDPEALRPLLARFHEETRLSLSVRLEALAVVEEFWQVPERTAMWRMLLPPEQLRPVPHPAMRRLAAADVPALERLYADGAESGEAPDFFHPSMIEQGIFYGIAEDEELVAAAGTHLVSVGEGVGAIGNVYTRRDRRGRGLAGAVTTAVAGALQDAGIRTVALNVAQANAGAVRVYERLGFERYCPFYEGLAVQPAP